MLGLLGNKYSIQIKVHSIDWFAGTFNDFENPPILHTLLKFNLLGTSDHVENETHRKGIDRSISVACQYISQSTKSSKHVNCKPQENVTRNREVAYTVETPLNVGTGIYIHQKIYTGNLSIFCQTWIFSLIVTNCWTLNHKLLIQF